MQQHIKFSLNDPAGLRFGIVLRARRTGTIGAEQAVEQVSVGANGGGSGLRGHGSGAAGGARAAMEAVPLTTAVIALATRAAPTTEATAQDRKPLAVSRKNTSWV